MKQTTINVFTYSVFNTTLETVVNNVCRVSFARPYLSRDSYLFSVTYDLIRKYFATQEIGRHNSLQVEIPLTFGSKETLTSAFDRLIKSVNTLQVVDYTNKAEEYQRHHKRCKDILNNALWQYADRVVDALVTAPEFGKKLSASEFSSIYNALKYAYRDRADVTDADIIREAAQSGGQSESQKRMQKAYNAFKAENGSNVFMTFESFSNAFDTFRQKYKDEGNKHKELQKAIEKLKASGLDAEDITKLLSE